MKTFGNYYYWGTLVGQGSGDYNVLGSIKKMAAQRYSNYVAVGTDEKVNGVSGWITGRSYKSGNNIYYNNETASLELYKGSLSDGNSGNITINLIGTQSAVSDDESNTRVSMSVHPDSRSLADGDIVIFTIKRTTGDINNSSLYYDFNTFMEVEK